MLTTHISLCALQMANRSSRNTSTTMRPAKETKSGGEREEEGSEQPQPLGIELGCSHLAFGQREHRVLALIELLN